MVDLQRQAGKPSGSNSSVTEEVEREFGDKIRADQRRWPACSRRRHRRGPLGELSMDSTEEDVLRQVQRKMSPRPCSSKIRLQAVLQPVREQFESDLRALTDAEQDSKELKSAKRQRSSTASSDTVSCRSRSARRSARARPRPRKTRSRRTTSRSRRRRSTRNWCAARSRWTSTGPTAAVRRRSVRSSARSAFRPRVHGSGLFTRGQTQIMSLLTLGTAKEGQRIDDLSLETDRRFMPPLQLPPYSVGETGFMRGPKRRDIGHGALAQRSLEPVIPSTDEFPYTIRIVSETLESNGSSSMGSVCGSTLALMDAGVPIKATGLRHRHGPRQRG